MQHPLRLASNQLPPVPDTGLEGTLASYTPGLCCDHVTDQELSRAAYIFRDNYGRARCAYSRPCPVHQPHQHANKIQDP